LAGFWGFVGGASLLVEALRGLYAGASQRVISVVMAVGAGVLISSVAFELMEEAYREGGFDSPAIGLLLGALLYFAVDRAHGVARCLSERPWPRTPGSPSAVRPPCHWWPGRRQRVGPRRPGARFWQVPRSRARRVFDRSSSS
jgi:hypothetical protein